MRGHRSTDSVAVTREDVNDTLGETSLLDNRAHADSGQRGKLGRLENDAVSGGESGAELPGEHEEREVPGNDLADDTDGFVARVAKLVLVGLDCLARDLIGPSSIVLDGGDGERRISSLGPSKSFA